MLKKRDSIIASIICQQTRYLKKSLKFGIELPKTVEQVYACEILPDGKKVITGHQFWQCHMIFNIKMEDFRCKVRLVAGEHMMDGQATVLHSSIVPREIARIALMIAALNDLEVKSGNILNV